MYRKNKTMKCKACLATLRESGRIDTKVSVTSSLREQKIAGLSRWTNILDRFNRGFFRLPCLENEKEERQLSPSSSTFHPRVRKFFFCIDKMKLYSRDFSAWSSLSLSLSPKKMRRLFIIILIDVHDDRLN